MKKKVSGGTVVYRGVESFVPFSASKKEARSRISLPQESIEFLERYYKTK
jgi:hypothetical protein